MQVPRQPRWITHFDEGLLVSGRRGERAGEGVEQIFGVLAVAWPELNPPPEALAGHARRGRARPCATPARARDDFPDPLPPGISRKADPASAFPISCPISLARGFRPAEVDLGLCVRGRIAAH